MSGFVSSQNTFQILNAGGWVGYAHYDYLTDVESQNNVAGIRYAEVGTVLRVDAFFVQIIRGARLAYHSIRFCE